MKRLFRFFGIATIALFMTATSAFALSTTINSVTPNKNVGVYEKTEDVVFTAGVSNAANEEMLVVIKNINGEAVASKSFLIGVGVSELELNIGRFNPGWYRLYLCDASGSVSYNKYAAFVVTEPYASRTIYKNAPLALDARVGESKKDATDYGDAYKLMGISQVRERAYYSDAYGGKTTLGTTTKEFSERNIDSLAVWTPDNNSSSWRADLSTVYNWQKFSSDVLNGRVNSWEIVNEPDSKSGLPADLYSAYLKAAALGVYDADPQLKKSFGAVCNTASGAFAEYMMQNGVMNFVDSYNIHTHQDGADSYQFRPLIGEIIKQGRLNSTIYGGGSSIWVSESGLRLNLGTGNVPTQNALKTQSAYVITSLMEAIEQSDAEKYFYFLGTHYIESNKEYGIFSENNMPYPAVSTISTLTYYLGKGEFLGMLKGTKDSTKGLVFDTGAGRAVVLYNTALASGNIQIDTAHDAIIVDLVGGTKTRIPNQGHNKINVPMPNTPIIVVLDDDIVQYQEKKFENNTDNREITNVERLIIQPLWPENLQVAIGGYILEQGQSYDITYRVYNMSQSMLTGTLYFNGTNQIEVSKASTQYRLSKGTSQDITVKVTVKSDAVPISKGYLSVSGSKCTPCVSAFKISDTNIESIIDSRTQISGFYSGWTRNDSANSRSYTSSGNTAKISATWNVSSPAWIYPKKALNQDATGYDGFYFTLNMDKIGNNETGVFSINTYLNGIIANAGRATTASKTFYVPFENYSGLDISNITEARIGFTEYDGQGTFSYTISDMGFYKVKKQGLEYERPEINIDFEDEQVFMFFSHPRQISATVPDELSNVKVYVNYKEYQNFTIEGSTVNIDTSGLDSGAVNIIVTGRDEFNYAVYDRVSYYVKKRNEGHTKGVFF